MTRRATFTQADIARAIRALKAVGETITGVENTPEGGFRVLTAANPQSPPSETEADWRGRLGSWRKSA